MDAVRVVSSENGVPLTSALDAAVYNFLRSSAAPSPADVIGPVLVSPEFCLQAEAMARAVGDSSTFGVKPGFVVYFPCRVPVRVLDALPLDIEVDKPPAGEEIDVYVACVIVCVVGVLFLRRIVTLLQREADHAGHGRHVEVGAEGYPSDWRCGIPEALLPSPSPLQGRGGYYHRHVFPQEYAVGCVVAAHVRMYCLCLKYAYPSLLFLALQITLRRSPHQITKLPS